MKDARIRNCQFAFKCDKRWEELEPTPLAEVRHCTQCEHDVYYCATDAELAKAVRLNRCVAVDAPRPMAGKAKGRKGRTGDDSGRLLGLVLPKNR